MIKKTIKDLDLDIYSEVLDNGLKVFLVPLENRKNYQINYFTKFGAGINEFVPVNESKKIKVPYGVAHFLEHKMFEQEDGEDPFSFFSKSGSDANASTGYKTTSYTVEGNNNIEENLEFLLNYVNSPHFTDENVEKEKGIIIEEVNMYQDEPETKLFDKSNKAVFKYHPYRVDIGGTEKSVRSITKEVLYKCYNTFYQPNNMFILIVGSFDKDKVLNVIKNNKKLNARKDNQEVVVIKSKEGLDVNKKLVEMKINNLALPKFVLTFKTDISNISKIDRYKYKMIVDIFLYILYGSSSIFREEMFRKNLMTMFYSSKYIVDDFLLIEIIAETKKPKELYKEVIKTFKNLEITKNDVERVKKVKIANEIYSTDKVQSIMNNLTNCLVDTDDIVYNKIDLLKSITIDDILAVKKSINLDNSSFVIGYNKE